MGEEVFRAYRDLYADRTDDKPAICLLLTTEPYPEGEQVVMYGMYVGPPAEAAAAFAPIEALGEPLYSSIGETSYFDLLAGGAIARVPSDATAFVHRAPLHNASIISQWQRNEETDVNVSWIDDFAESLRPHLTGEVYQNYARDLPDWETSYYGANYPRLQQIKLTYDPGDAFHTPQSIRLP